MKPNDNPIMDIAEQTKTILFPRPVDMCIFGSNGERKEADYTMELQCTARGLLEQAIQHCKDNADRIDPNSSIMDYFKDRAMRDFPNRPAYIADLLNEAERLGQWDGEPASILSLKYHWIEEGPGGTDCFVANTYENILDHIAKPILRIIRLGEEIKRITRLITSTYSNFLLETNAGHKYSFDEVVVTCPLGWLKQHKGHFFDPPLPPKLSKAIDNMGYGRLEKLYLTFPSPFWLSTAKDEQTDTALKHPCCTHFHHPTYIEGPLAYPANQVTYSLAYLRGGADHPTLLFYIHGPYGAQICRLLTDLEVHSEAYNNVIDDYARPFYSRLPNYCINNSNCKPLSYFCSAWQLDPFAGNGSYSYFQVGQINGKEDVEIMRDSEGLGESEGLWLAGEHVAPFERLGTTAGAYLAGEHVAKRICRKWNIGEAKE